MALTSNDETDLLLPLYRGFDETPRFATLLARLRRRAGARQADLVIDGDASTVSASVLDPTMRNALRPYRAYSLAELTDRPLGVSDARIVMFPLPDGSRGWLYIASEKPCTAADSALLSSLAPYVQSVVSAWQEMERERAACALSSDGLVKTGSGWILFDADARVVAIEPETRRRLGALAPAVPTVGERLRGIAPGAERHLVQTSAQCIKGHSPDQPHCVLLADPRVEAVLEPVARGSQTASRFPEAAMIAWCRFDTPDSPARAAMLAGLHDLPQREAELAVAIADGLSISEAAERMGLTLETARNYSMQLYAKLDVSGQAQLVRLVQRSGAMLA